MPVWATQLEGETLMLLETETTGAFGKSENEIRPVPLLAFERSVEAIGSIGRIISQRIQNEYVGRGIRSAEVRFGVKIDQAGSVMISQEHDKCQFAVTLSIRTEQRLGDPTPGPAPQRGG